MAKNKYYAVRVGKTPGVYLTWEECRRQVSGYPGAVYKSFPTRQEAEGFMTGDGMAKASAAGKKTTELEEQKPTNWIL